MGIETVARVNDASCQTQGGIDTIRWVETDGAYWNRAGGKGVALSPAGHYYRNAVATSSVLAGFLAIDAIGVTGGHPAVSPSTGTKIPVNFGVNKTAIYPTTGRLALETDVGVRYDIYVSGEPGAKQYLNLLAQTLKPLVVTEIIGDGRFVAVGIPSSQRVGDLVG